MNPIHGDQLLTPLNWRYVTKEFDPARKISPEDWTVVELAANGQVASQVSICLVAVRLRSSGW